MSPYFTPHCALGPDKCEACFARIVARERSEKDENRATGIPQDRNSAAPSERKADGTFKPGSKSANPGGQPKWVKQFRDSLKDIAPKGQEIIAKIYARALDTSALERIVEDGESTPEQVLRAEKQMHDRFSLAQQATAEVLKYTLPKPTTRVKVDGKMENPLAGMTTEQLLEWGRNLKSKPEEGK